MRESSGKLEDGRKDGKRAGLYRLNVRTIDLRKK